jgi:hypothetical protein
MTPAVSIEGQGSKEDKDHITGSRTVADIRGISMESGNAYIPNAIARQNEEVVAGAQLQIVQVRVRTDAGLKGGVA